MKTISMERKLLFRLGAVFMLLMIATSACSFLPGSGDGEAPDAAPQPVAAVTDTQIPTPSSSPTVVPSPTDSPVPTEVLSPTTRPTWTPLPSRTLRPTWTASPTLSPTATKDVGWIIKEDFSDTGASWIKKKGGNWATGIARGAYFMTVESPNVEITSSKSWLKLADVRVIADIYKQNGKGYWGISCRETAAESYYTIFITSAGEYGWGETRGGKVDLNILGSSDKIFTGQREVNHIMAECRGNALTLYVNDEFIFRQYVEGISTGFVGMMAGTQPENDRLTVFFDNLEIWGPLETEE
jgi:hypothetical protein